MTTRLGPEARAAMAREWETILAGVASGDGVGKTLARSGVSPQVCAAWRLEDATRRAQWDAAREMSADSFMDEAIEVARTGVQVVRDDAGEIIKDKDGKPLITQCDAAYARVHVDTLKWAARVRNPRTYADKAQLDVNVKTIDLTRIIQEANARLAAGRAPRILEHDAPPHDALAHAAIGANASKLLELL